MQVKLVGRVQCCALIALLEYIDLIHSHTTIMYIKHLRKQAKAERARIRPR